MHHLYAQCLQKPRKGLRFPGAEATGILGAAQCGCWELISALCKGQQALLTTELSRCPAVPLSLLLILGVMALL